MALLAQISKHSRSTHSRAHMLFNFMALYHEMLVTALNSIVILTQLILEHGNECENPYLNKYAEYLSRMTFSGSNFWDI